MFERWRERDSYGSEEIQCDIERVPLMYAFHIGVGIIFAKYLLLYMQLVNAVLR